MCKPDGLRDVSVPLVITVVPVVVVRDLDTSTQSIPYVDWAPVQLLPPSRTESGHEINGVLLKFKNPRQSREGFMDRLF